MSERPFAQETPQELADPQARQSMEAGAGGQEEELGQILEMLLGATNVDFSVYKTSTVRRRVRRRMSGQQIVELVDYVRYLQEHPGETLALYNDLLVGVTELFRDPDVFEELKASVFTELLQNRHPGRPIRIWVPGCSRGDEAYTIAICALEAMGSRREPVRVQLFATDLKEGALTQARTGRYPSEVVERLPDWAQPYFVKLTQGYQVSRRVRDMCIFARQDVTKDPPFSRLDLVSCRNLLIYLALPSQRRALSNFHYALRPGGVLLLGASEYLGDCETLFEPLDKKCKIFRRRATAVAVPLSFTPSPAQTGWISPQTEVPTSMELPIPEHDIGKYVDRLLLARYTPPGVVIDESYNVLAFRGRTGAFLEPPDGVATYNLLKMAREGLLAALRSALPEAFARQTVVRCERLQVRDGGETRELDLEILPLRLHEEQTASCCLVLFLEKPREAEAPACSLLVEPPGRNEAEGLRRELQATRDYLSSIIGEREASYEELRAANEEAQSANEELQSANEELETAKEELQSTNEELATINEELNERNRELQKVNSDLSNILANLDVPMVILDRGLAVQRFTPSAQSLLKLIPSDLGRPLNDLRCEVDLPDLWRLVADVLDTLQAQEFERQSTQGRRYLVRLRPYQTLEGDIDRVILSFTDLSVPTSTNP